VPNRHLAVDFAVSRELTSGLLPAALGRRARYESDWTTARSYFMAPMRNVPTANP
jgi:hypothetical protein